MITFFCIHAYQNLLPMPIVTLFQNPKKIIESKPLLTILTQIKKGKLKEEILNLRKLFNSDQDHDFDIQKRVLPFFCVSGHYTKENERIRMVNYSGFQLLEIPYLPEEDKKKICEILIKDPFCFAVFEAATGFGINIIVKTNGQRVFHKSTFWQVRKYYEQLTGVKRFSIQGEDIHYLCLFSFDENTYINLEAKVFSVNELLRDEVS